MTVNSIASDYQDTFPEQQFNKCLLNELNSFSVPTLIKECARHIDRIQRIIRQILNQKHKLQKSFIFLYNCVTYFYMYICI